MNDPDQRFEPVYRDRAAVVGKVPRDRLTPGLTLLRRGGREVCLGNLRLIDLQGAPSLVRQGAGIDGEHPELSLRLVLTASALTAIRALSL